MSEAERSLYSQIVKAILCCLLYLQRMQSMNVPFLPCDLSKTTYNNAPGKTECTDDNECP